MQNSRSKKIHVLAIGYAKQALVSGSREQDRMKSCAKSLQSFHMIVFTKREQNLEKTEAVHIDNLHVHPTNSRFKILMPFDAVRIACRIIKAQKGGWIVSSQDPFETSVIGRTIARLCRVPHHIQLHSDFYRNEGWLHESKLNSLRRTFGLYFLKRAAGIRVVAPGIKDVLIARGVAKEKIVVLPVYVALEPFLEIGAQRIASTYEKPSRITFVGRLAPEKNLPLLIHAFASLDTTHAELTIVGSGPEEDTIRTLVHDLEVTERVHFVSWTNDVADELAKTDIFVLPSLYEGWPLVLLEAMASAVPVVASNVGSIAEMFEVEKGGFLFPLNDEDALRTHLDAILNSTIGDYVTLSREAYRTAQKHHYTIEEYAELWGSSFTSSVEDV